MLNKVILMGRLTRDPELRHTQTSIPVASFSLAVDRQYSKGSDKTTDFIDIVAWRNTAEFVSKWFTKGMLVAVTGRLQVRDYTDKEGNKRRAYEVVADETFFAESKRGGDAPSRPAYQESAPDYSAPPSYESDFAEIEDDGELPF